MKSYKNTQDIIYEISDFIDSILELIQGIGFQDYRIDRKLKIKIVKHFQAIESLACLVSNEDQEQFPDIPWEQIKNLTINFIHFESGLNDIAVWEQARHNIIMIQKKLLNRTK